MSVALYKPKVRRAPRRATRSPRALMKRADEYVRDPAQRAAVDDPLSRVSQAVHAVVRLCDAVRYHQLYAGRPCAERHGVRHRPYRSAGRRRQPRRARQQALSGSGQPAASLCAERKPLTGSKPAARAGDRAAAAGGLYRLSARLGWSGSVGSVSSSSCATTCTSISRACRCRSSTRTGPAASCRA